MGECINGLFQRQRGTQQSATEINSVTESSEINKYYLCKIIFYLFELI